MTGLDLALCATSIAGVVLFCLLFSKRVRWNWTLYTNMDPNDTKHNAPFWLALVSLLSLGAVFFSVHALLVVHGIVR